MYLNYRESLPNGGIVAAEITCETDQRESENNPFRGVEIVPIRSIAKIARIGVMKIVIPLAKADEGDQPTVATTILLAVGLCPYHMTE